MRFHLHELVVMRLFVGIYKANSGIVYASVKIVIVAGEIDEARFFGLFV